MKSKHITGKFRALWHAKIAKHLIGGVESANLGLIFLAAMGHFLSSAQFVLFPVAIGTSALTAIMSVRDAYRHGKKKHSKITNAVADTVTALGIIGAVVCAFVGGAALGVIAPALLTGTLGLKALYDLGAACYYWYQYHHYHHLNPQKAAKCYKKAKSHTLHFVVEALGAAAAGAVLLADQSAFGALGLTAGVIGAGYATYETVKAYKKHKAVLKARAKQQTLIEDPDVEQPLLSHEVIRQRLGYSSNSFAETIEPPPDLNEANAPQKPWVFEYPSITSDHSQPTINYARPRLG